LIDYLAEVVRPCVLGSTSGENLVFLTGSDDPGLMVVDGERDRPVRFLTPSYTCYSPSCCDPGTGKLFCAVSPPGVEVLDVNSGQAVTYIPTGHEVSSLSCDTANHIVYVGGTYPAALTLIDAVGDSIIGAVRLGMWSYEGVYACVNDRDHTVYVGAWDFDSVCVFNSTCESLLRVVPLQLGHVWGQCYNPFRNRLYCSGDEGLVEVDCVAGELVKRYDVGNRIHTMCTNRTGDRLYCADQRSGMLVTIDCQAQRVVDSVAVGGYTEALCFNSVSDKVYCRSGGDTLTVVAGLDGRVLARLVVGDGYGPESMCFDSATNTLLCADHLHQCFHVIDGQSDRVARSISTTPSFGSIVAPARSPYVFGFGGPDIAVIRKDSTTAEFGVTAAPGRTSGSLVRGKLFCTGNPGSVLMNAAGRKVLDLHPGVNDVGGLPSGIYFVREQSAVRKVVITR
jgi:DNA-binding beta-propeller fold protein YncE